MPCFSLTSLLLVAEEAAAAAETAESTGLLNMDRLPLLGVAVFFVVAVVFWISVARSGGQIKVREIAGLKAIEEAVGRATEMGRSVLFVPGIQDVSEIQTIAGITVLSKVAKTAAEYDAKVEVPVARTSWRPADRTPTTKISSTT